jgi:hypothetical protein
VFNFSKHYFIFVNDKSYSFVGFTIGVKENGAELLEVTVDGVVAGILQLFIVSLKDSSFKYRCMDLLTKSCRKNPLLLIFVLNCSYNSL